MAALEYDFRVINERALDQALASIERRISRHNAFVARSFGGSSGGRGTPTSVAARARSPGAAKQDIGRHYAEIGKAARAASLKEGRERIAMERRVAAERQRLATKSKAAELNHWREIGRAARAQYLAEGREQIRAAKRAEAANKRAAAAAASSRARFASATAGRIGTAGRDAASAVGRLAIGALSIGGGFALAGALSAQSREQARASQLANQAGNPALKGQLLREARGVKGFTGEEALGGLESFVTKTGDLETGRKILGDLGQLALATGTNLSDLGDTAGQAFNVIRDQIQDPKKQVEELNSLMSVLAQQGALGAVEIRDLARDFGKLGAATRGFEGGAPDLLRTMGAFAQLAVARGGAESSADASTAASRLASDIVAKREKFAALGVDIKSKKDPTKLRGPADILADVLEKTGGDITKTSGLFGMESAKIFRGLSPVFTEAEKRKKGSGRAAVMQELGRFTGATLDPRQLKERAASRLSDPDLQFKEALKDFNRALGESLLPTLTRLVPQFAKLLPYIERAAVLFGKLIDDLAANPIAGLGKLILMKVAADLAMANIGSSITKAMTAMIASATSKFGGGPGGGGSGGGGKAGAAGLGLQLGLTAATVILTAGIVNIEKTEAEMQAAGKNLSMVRGAGVEDLEMVREAVKNQRKLTEDTARPGMVEQAATEAAKILPSFLMSKPGVEGERQFGRDVAEFTTARRPDAIKFQENTLKEMQLKLGELEAAAVKAAAALNTVSNAGSGPNRADKPSPIKG